MAQFIAAVHATGATPHALALVETGMSASGATYTVRTVRSLGDSPFDEIESLLASERQYVGNTVVVTTGGQKAADALHAHGPSAAAVTLRADSSADRDAHDTTTQVLVDTFEMLYRAGAVTLPTPTDAASGALRALYQGADLDNAAPDGERDESGDLDASDASGPSAVEVEQSGSSAALSTETVKRPLDAREASAAAVAMDVRTGRIAAETNEDAPDLGEHEAPALALALAVWYGETTADDLPETDQADEINQKRANRNAARNG
ncbi:hypothetical protein [Rubricoccus marinus]|uniref:Uncharacterized protein n=1 Tax=Rubricoccus marinus TaxID=716817 RepID=A0A259TYV3_9BACT|nr:hypothetical protein [Rubricoccus marinus]OZC02932.1 hypothetical protein BSZ36_08070 [Rubricoccus marinus]